MADVIHVDRGFPPWSPSQDATLVKQYQYYEIPLAGIIEQHGCRFFFMCLGGADEDVNLWVYFRVTPQVEEAFNSSDRASFGEAIEIEGPAVMAIGVDGPGIVASTVLDEVDKDALRAASSSLYEELKAWAVAARDLAANAGDLISA